VCDGFATCGRLRDDVVAKAIDECVRGFVLGSRCRLDEDDRDRLRIVELRLVHRRYTFDALDALVDPLWSLLVAFDVDDDRDRAVEAWAEAFGEEIVRPPRRLLLGLCALIRCAEMDKCRGSRKAKAGYE